MLDKRNKYDMLVIIGDVNVKVGEENINYEWVMGKYELGVWNYNGEKFCDMCDMNELVIIGILFFYKIIYKVIWILLDGWIRN